MKVKTMRGELIDMSLLVAKNENAIALGNASMNARGDIIGPNGEVLKARSMVAQDYYAANPKAVKQVALRNLSAEVFVSPAEAAATAFGTAATTSVTEEDKQTAASPTAQRKRKIEDRD